MINWINTKATRSMTDYVAASIYELKDKEKQSAHLCLRFSPEAQKDLRLIYGDRLVVGFDEDTKEICFKRVTGVGGHKLSYASTRKIETEEDRKNAILTLQVKVERPPVKAVQYPSSEVKTESTHFAIAAPEFFS